MAHGSSLKGFLFPPCLDFRLPQQLSALFFWRTSVSRKHEGLPIKPTALPTLDQYEAAPIGPDLAGPIATTMKAREVD